MKLPRTMALLAGVSLLSVGMLTMTGCEKRERILEVETPRGSLQIDRVEEPSDIEIDVNRRSDE